MRDCLSLQNLHGGGVVQFQDAISLLYKRAFVDHPLHRRAIFSLLAAALNAAHDVARCHRIEQTKLGHGRDDRAASSLLELATGIGESFDEPLPFRGLCVAEPGEPFLRGKVRLTATSFLAEGEGGNCDPKKTNEPGCGGKYSLSLFLPERKGIGPPETPPDGPAANSDRQNLRAGLSV